MTYYVFKAVRGQRWPNNWKLVSEHEKIEDAEAAAGKLCPAGPQSTEPGEGLAKAYFGSKFTDRWSAMISTTKELT